MGIKGLSSRDLEKLLLAQGAGPHRQGRGSHVTWVRTLSDGTTLRTTVAANKKLIPAGTIGRIRRQLALTPAAGVSDEDFVNGVRKG